MKVVLIYATKPEPKPLKFVHDASDVEGEITKQLSVSEDRAKAAAERAEKDGGDVATLGIQRWSSAKWTEVEIDLG